MFSLRIPFLLALSSYAVSGYSVVVPYEYDNPYPESKTHETTTPPPDKMTSPVPETTPAPTVSVGEPVYRTTLPPPVEEQNLTISGPPHRKGTTACLCKECTTDDGCVIKHYRQYNYYYPNGQKVSIPFKKPDPIKPSELSANDIPVSSSIHMTNHNGRVTVQTVTKPAVSFNLPGVVSYVPNNGHNFVYNPAVLGLHQSAPVFNNAPMYNPINQVPVPSNPPAEDKSEPAPVDEPVTPSPTDEDVNKDIMTYLSDPNTFGQTTMTVIKNGNNPHFQSQQFRMSSMVQSPHPLPMPAFQSNIDWLGGTLPSAGVFKPNVQYFNPFRPYPHHIPQQFPLFQHPLYSVVV